MKIDSTTHPDLFASMDVYVKTCGFWAYPDAEWQHAFIDAWLAGQPCALQNPVEHPVSPTGESS